MRRVASLQTIAIVVAVGFTQPTGAIAQEVVDPPDAAAESLQAEEQPPDEPADGRPTWTPTLGFGFDIQASQVSAAFYTDEIPRLPGGTRSYELAGEKWISPPQITLTGQLFSPELTPRFGRPRLFLHVGGQIPTNVNHVLANDVGVIRGDATTGRTRDSGLLDVNVVGNWMAGVGIDFAVPVRGRTLSIRPSLLYFGTSMRYRAKVLFQEQIDPSVASNPYATAFKGWAAIPTVYQGLAPSVSLDVPLGRRGPIGLGLYAEFQPVVILGERRRTTVVPNQVGAGTGVASFEIERVTYQGGVGLRLYWTGS